jgi:hypothetical protein
MLEIACFNKESAVIAAKAGADRIGFVQIIIWAEPHLMLKISKV